MSTPALQDEINKRLSLNLLIEGAAQHAFLTAHYLVRDEINAIDPKLLKLYDQFAIAGFLQYWYSEGVLFFGRPSTFWKKAATRRSHPFYSHRLLSRHGGALALAAKDRVIARAREKGVTRLPVWFSIQTWIVLSKIRARERNHIGPLNELGKRATEMVFGIDPDRLEADLSREVAFGTLSRSHNFTSALLRGSAIGYGGVLRRGEELKVVARAWIWPILSHELVKGVMELICMHGMVDLDESTYGDVVKSADRIEYEPWLLQAGAEFWRLLIGLLPGGRPLAEMVMHIARLPARSLEALLVAVVEDPNWARELLASLGAD